MDDSMLDADSYSGPLSVELLRRNVRTHDDVGYRRLHGSMKNTAWLYYARPRDDIADETLIVSLMKSRFIESRGLRTLERNTRKFIHCRAEIDQSLVDYIEAFLDSGQFPSSDILSLPPHLVGGRMFYTLEVIDNSARKSSKSVICFEHGKLRFITKLKLYRGLPSIHGNGRYETYEFEDHRAVRDEIRSQALDPTLPFLERIELTLEANRSSHYHDRGYNVHKAHIMTQFANNFIDFDNGTMISKMKGIDEDEEPFATRHEYSFDRNTIFSIEGFNGLPTTSLTNAKELVDKVMGEFYDLKETATFVASYGYSDSNVADHEAVLLSPATVSACSTECRGTSASSSQTGSVGPVGPNSTE